MLPVDKCWCNSNNLISFSEHYNKCQDCLSIVVKFKHDDKYYSCGDDNDNLYNKNYWTPSDTSLNTNCKSLSMDQLPNIYERSRLDLPERCIYWLRHILKYKLPSADMLEIGCGHSGLLALSNQAGFTVLGTEMSPIIVDYAKKTFNTDIICTDADNIHFTKKYDCIVLMDVLEHLINPIQIMQKCSDGLKDEGILVIQTPCYRKTEKDYQELLSENDSFLYMLREWEHIYLFSEIALKKLLQQCGLANFVVEPQLFPYDIFLFASKKPLRINNESEIEKALLQSPSGRIIDAMLHLYKKADTAEKECDARLKVIQELDARRNFLENQLSSSSSYMSAEGASMYKQENFLSKLKKIKNKIFT